MELLAAKAVATLAMPPGINVLLALVGLILLARYRVAAIGLLLISVVSLYAFSTPLVANALSENLETVSPYPLRAAGASEAQAIVVLGGGQTDFAPEYGGQTVSAEGLERLRYAAKLHNTTGLPILVTGGRPRGESWDEASLMKRVLIDDFKVPVRWTESKARNTHENAVHAAELLEDEGIRRVFLVSHAAHLPRAVASFKRQEIDVVPAPTGYQKGGTAPGMLSLLPSADALEQSAGVFHEHLGALWYRWRHG